VQTHSCFRNHNANSDINAEIQTAREQGFEAIVVQHQGLTKKKIDTIRKTGLEVGVWTINNEADMPARPDQRPRRQVRLIRRHLGFLAPASHRDFYE